MLSNELNKSLAPFYNIASARALAPHYRALELTPNCVKARSSFGMLEMYIDIGIKETVFVDAMAFLSIVASLPSRTDLKLTTKGDVLQWNCGPARGKLALMNVKDPPEIPEVWGEPAKTTKDFAHVLERGALSCDNEALGAKGLFGVELHNKDGLTVCSTDSVTLSHCSIPRRVVGLPEKATLHPSGIELLASVMNNDGNLTFADTDVLYQDDTVLCYMRQIPPLRESIVNMIDQWEGEEVISPIPRDRIAAFIKRANALTESKRQTRVLVSGAQESLILSFEEGTATSDEYVIAEELPPFPDLEPVPLSASKVARALSYIDSVIMDHIERKVLIFKGGHFRYLISGSVS